MIKLQELRTEKGISQAEIAAVFGFTQQGYSRYERGERECSYDTLIRFAKYFDVSIDYLLGNSTYFYPDSVKQSTVSALSPEEQKLLNNYRIMRADLRPTLLSMSETLAKTPAEIAGNTQKKKA